ncbi:Acetyltransferase (GNAT) family protein [Nonomuraea solani]|uniref:Acetyltransferase (GNAT) family protein n=1 Tax=Nonomuraea solani TaxID=1144553 RepID=A0A1H6ERD5_9ACTN|nr:Acetyltransferase (GNAT) family protein [Nonomuraea solani]
MGYALYALPHQIVRLTHLCISPDYRSRGLARQLVDAITRDHGDRFGIALKCRTDYVENALWPRLGFIERGRTPGRSKKRLPLSIWWRDHGHPDLFSSAESLDILKVALDVNVFVDIENGDDRAAAKESHALIEDWLVGQVELTITPELSREISRLPQCDSKSTQVAALTKYRTLTADHSTSDAMYQRLLDHAKSAHGLDLSIEESDRSDVRHIAEAYAAGVTVFVTRDERLSIWARSALDICGVRVMRPADVILYVDELARAQAYMPSQLLDTEYRLEPVRSMEEGNLLSFLNSSDGERKTDFLAKVRQLSAEGQKWERLILRDPHGNASALLIYGLEATQLTVPLIRVGNSRIEETIVRQLIYLARTQARQHKREIIRITDRQLSKALQRILRSEGFVCHNDAWIAFVIDLCANAAAVDEQTALAARHVDIRLTKLTTNLSPIIAADLERSLWPAKLVDSALPSYIVPIRPYWSAELFGVPQTLIPRSNSLGISREHVYYRSPIPRGERAPARLLWYVSSNSAGGLSAIIGCSRLEEVTVDSPQALHGRFQHLGVWSRQQVINASKGGKALALRFSDTELFQHHVPLRRMRQIATTFGQTLQLQSVSKISSDLFAAIYKEGQGP